MATFNFLIQSKKNPAVIYLRFREGDLDIKIRTDFSVDPSNWSISKKQLKNLKDINSKNLHSRMESYKLEILNAFNAELDKSKINKEWFNSIKKASEIESSKNDLTISFITYIEEREHKLEKSSLQKLKRAFEIVEMYETKRKRKVQLKEMNMIFLNDFINFLTIDLKYNETYSSRVIRFIRSVAIYARANGIETHPQIDLLVMKPGKIYKVFLSLEEIDQIKKYTLKDDQLDTARDWLIISCFTGQRISDFMSFDKKNIIEIQGHKMLDLKQKKTQKQIIIPLFKEVQEVLDKRNGEFPIPMIEQQYNKCVKQLCRAAGITKIIEGALVDPDTNRKKIGKYEKWQLITSHIGRRSLATNLYGKVRTDLIMAMTGHSKESTFLTYIGKGKVDHAIALAEAMKGFV